MSDKERKPTDAHDPSRRSMLWVLSGLAFGAVVTEAFWVMSDVLLPKRGDELETDGDIVVAGPVKQFKPGSTTAFPDGRFFLIRYADGGFLAVSRECTHLGCTVAWDGTTRQFLCPCHASVFDDRGVVTKPPAPRPLDIFPVRIENRIVKVDTRWRSRRSAFDPKDVARP